MLKISLLCSEKKDILSARDNVYNQHYRKQPKRLNMKYEEDSILRNTPTPPSPDSLPTISVHKPSDNVYQES